MTKMWKQSGSGPYRHFVRYAGPCSVVVERSPFSGRARWIWQLRVHGKPLHSGNVTSVTIAKRAGTRALNSCRKSDAVPD